MTTDPAKIVRCYERGILTELGAANDIIECTFAPPSAAFASGLPPELLARVRELAERYVGGETFIVQSYCGPDLPAELAKADRDARINWLIGQSLWRDYFKAHPDPRHDPARD